MGVVEDGRRPVEPDDRTGSSGCVCAGDLGRERHDLRVVVSRRGSASSSRGPAPACPTRAAARSPERDDEPARPHADQTQPPPAEDRGDRGADRSEVVVVMEVEIREDERRQHRGRDDREPEPPLRGTPDGDRGRNERGSRRARGGWARAHSQIDAPRPGSSRCRIQPKFQRRRFQPVSHSVNGLAALIASAWRVHHSPARSGTRPPRRRPGSNRRRRRRPPARAAGTRVRAGSRTPPSSASRASRRDLPASAAPGRPAAAGRARGRRANANPTAPAVARYSIIDVRLQTSANGVNANATTAPTPRDRARPRGARAPRAAAPSGGSRRGR